MLLEVMQQLVYQYNEKLCWTVHHFYLSISVKYHPFPLLFIRLLPSILWQHYSVRRSFCRKRERENLGTDHSYVGEGKLISDK
jgi:hypothetical protein